MFTSPENRSTGEGAPQDVPVRQEPGSLDDQLLDTNNFIKELEAGIIAETNPTQKKLLQRAIDREKERKMALLEKKFAGGPGPLPSREEANVLDKEEV